MRASLRDDVIALALVAALMLAVFSVLSLITRVRRRIEARRGGVPREDVQDTGETTD